MSLYSTGARPIIPALRHLLRVFVGYAARWHALFRVRLEPPDPACRACRVGAWDLGEQRKRPLPVAACRLRVARLDLDVAQVQQRTRLGLRVADQPVKTERLLIA